MILIHAKLGKIFYAWVRTPQKLFRESKILFLVKLVAWDPLFYNVTILTHILQTQKTFTQDKYILMLPGEKSFRQSD